MIASISKSGTATTVRLPTASQEIEDVTLFFSYDTLVGFAVGDRRVVRQNVWSTTTGKHLNNIDGGSSKAKGERVSESEFEMLYGLLVGAVVL